MNKTRIPQLQHRYRRSQAKIGYNLRLRRKVPDNFKKEVLPEEVLPEEVPLDQMAASVRRAGSQVKKNAKKFHMDIFYLKADIIYRRSPDGSVFRHKKVRVTK